MHTEKRKLKIQAIEARIKAGEAALEIAKQSLANTLCPFEVGDKLMCDGEPITVAEISYMPYGDRYIMDCYKTKNDGTLCRQHSRFYNDASDFTLGKNHVKT